MNHYHSDHIFEDKEARIQERIKACYKRACEVQEERNRRLCRMSPDEDYTLSFPRHRPWCWPETVHRYYKDWYRELLWLNDMFGRLTER